MTYVSSTTKPPSHSLSRECQVSNYFNVHMCLSHVEQCFHLSMSILFFYVHMHSSRVHGRHDVWVIRIYAQCLSSARQCGVMIRWRRIMRACSARQCGLAISWPIHDSTLRSLPIRDQPPPVSVECMSQSELFYGIPSKPYSIDGSRNLLHECTLHG